MRTARLFIGLMALVLVASMARGQGFGRNKVNYARDNWEVIKSDHFEIFYPKGALWLAEFTATTAEDALAQLEETWRYELENTIPMIIYTSHNSFSETNVIGGLISEGTGGFTEFNRNRIVIPFEGSYEQMRHVVHHELVHALQYDMFMSGSLKSLALNRLVSLPLWAVEGLAEFESMGWDAEADNVMRDATISDYVPPIEYMLGGVFAYKGGQSLYRYLAEAYGRDKVADFLRAMKQSANAERSLENVFGDSMEEIDKGWKTWLKREYWPEIAERKSPYEYADPLTDHMENGGYLNVGAEISPDGKQVAYVSTDRGFADVYLMNVETKKVERVITGQQSPDFESLFLLRPGIAWSPDGQYLAIVAKQHGKNALFIFDVQEREVERSYVYDLDAMFTPTWHPVGNRLIVVGLKDGWSDLYNIDVPAGTLTRLTNDPYDERDPDWSPDGKRIVFSTDRPNLDLYYEDTRPFEFGQYNLMTLELEPMTLEQLTYHPANDEFPVWGPDGRSILFVSERSGIGNLYLLDLTDNSARPVTDSLTSLQQIDWSANGEKVVFSAFSEGGYDIYLMGDPRAIAPGEVAPTLTEYARRAYADLAYDSTVTSDEEIAARVKDEEDGTRRPTFEPPKLTYEPSTFKPKFGASIPDDVESVAPQEEETPQPEETASGETTEEGGESTETASESETASEEESDAVHRKYSRPRNYKPKLGIESFGVNTQVSSFSGFSGQAYLSMSDLLGNQRLVIVTDQSISSVKNLNAVVSYAYLRNRFDYGVTAFHTRDFFLANERSPSYNQVVMVADRNIGMTAVGEYPFSQFSRLEMSGGFMRIERDRVGVRIYDYERVGAFGNVIRQVEEEPLDRKSLFPLELAYVHDTIGYGFFGPADGKRYRLSLSGAPATSNKLLQFATVEGDYRHYFRLNELQSFAVRFAAGHSRGRNAQQFFLGGVQTEISPRISASVDEQLRADEIFFPAFKGPLRGSDLYEFAGDSFVLTNLEWRFTLLEKLAIGWPLPMTFRYVGGLLFADAGMAFDADPVPDEDGVVANKFDSLDDLVGGIGFGTRFN
ncbi:MAG: hypothetical protein O3A46_10150, partial [Candidatus Poribacteria bacterium]|nr:hypothetical protein [Candidatus Poribacteria bacterium]